MDNIGTSGHFGRYDAITTVQLNLSDIGRRMAPLSLGRHAPHRRVALHAESGHPLARRAKQDNKRWHYKDLYIFCEKMDAMMDCHGANGALVGKNLLEMQTVDGQYFVKDCIEIVRNSGSGWLNYKRANPLSKQVEEKMVMVTKVPGYDGFIGTGIYKPLSD